MQKSLDVGILEDVSERVVGPTSEIEVGFTGESLFGRFQAVLQLLIVWVDIEALLVGGNSLFILFEVEVGEASSLVAFDEAGVDFYTLLSVSQSLFVLLQAGIGA